MLKGMPDPNDIQFERLRFCENPTNEIWYSSTGDIVETTKTQTLTNKTLTSPVITNPTINSVSVTGEVVETTKVQNVTNKFLMTSVISDLNQTAQENIDIIEYS
jgi:microcompartment protein CcmK/EutM